MARGVVSSGQPDAGTQILRVGPSGHWSRPLGVTLLIRADVRMKLEEANWEEVALRLTDHALRKIRRLRWRTGSWQRIPGGAMAEDFANEAIALLLSGERDWDPSNCPDLLTWLRGVVDSLVSHLVESEEHHRSQQFPRSEGGQDLEELLRRADPAEATAVHLVPVQVDQETHLAERQVAEQLIGALFEEISGDKELEAMLDSLMDGCEKPRDIAVRTGMDVARVYKLREKLDRAIKRIEGRIGQ